MNGNWGSSYSRTPNTLQPHISQFRIKQISVLTQMNDDSDSSFKLLPKMNTRYDTACLLGQLTIPAGRGHSVQSRNRLSQLRCPAITPLTLKLSGYYCPGKSLHLETLTPTQPPYQSSASERRGDTNSKGVAEINVHRLTPFKAN